MLCFFPIAAVAFSGTRRLRTVPSCSRADRLGPNFVVTCQSQVSRDYRSNLGLGSSVRLVDVGPPLFCRLVVVPMMRCEITSPEQPWPGHPDMCRYGLIRPFLVTRRAPVRAVSGLGSGGLCWPDRSESGSGVSAQITHEFPSRPGQSPGYRQQTGARPVVSHEVLSTFDGSGGE